MMIRQDTNWVVSFFFVLCSPFLFSASPYPGKSLQQAFFSQIFLCDHDMTLGDLSVAYFLIYTYCLIHGLCAYN